MAMSLAVKRPAEELLDTPYHSITDSIGSSPMTMLSDVSQPRGAKRRKARKDDFPSFIRPSANVYEPADESDSGASVGDYSHSDEMDDRALSLSTIGKIPAETFSLDTIQHPQVNGTGQQGFPCIWLNGNSPTRHPEEEDRAPESVAAQFTQPKTLEVQTPPELPVESRTPPPPLDPLPKGTVIIQPSQPCSEENQAPTPMYKSITPPLGEHRDNGIQRFGTPQTPTTVAQKNHINGMFVGNRHGNSDSDVSTDLNSGVDADGNSMEVCPQCNKVFKRKVYLQRHMEREHWSTAKVFKCEDCAYETKHQSNLSVHRRTHTGERPYHCGACGQRYTQGHLLKSHIRSRHGGNMELYNLEKKSESTRGRKSLDMKHESLLGVPPHHKQDKISALLQAAAANSAGAMAAGQQLPQLPKFGGGLMTPPYMNSLSYFNSLRPMMGNPLSLTGGLLGSPRFFPMGGLSNPNGFPGQSPNSMLSSLNSPLSMLTSQSCLTSSASESLKKTIEAMDMKPKMNIIPMLSSPSSTGGLQIPVKLEMPSAQLPKIPSLPQLSPQDLTTKKSPAEADVPDLYPHKHSMTSEAEPQDLSNPRYALTSGASPARPQESDSATIPSPGGPEDITQYTHKKLNRQFRLHTLQTEDYVMTNSEDEELVKESSPEPSEDLEVSSHKCGDGCPHLKKLKDLRRNVFRMLSVFTPDLSFENGISSETDDVDELLYEVIYTNIEEENGGASKD